MHPVQLLVAVSSCATAFSMVALFVCVNRNQQMYTEYRTPCLFCHLFLSKRLGGCKTAAPKPVTSRRSRAVAFQTSSHIMHPVTRTRTPWRKRKNAAPPAPTGKRSYLCSLMNDGTFRCALHESLGFARCPLVSAIKVDTK